MGGSETKVYEPTPAPAPSTADAINAWVQALPEIRNQQLQTNQLEASQQLDLMRQYGPQLAEQYQNIQKQLNPVTSGLQEQLATQASEGMQNGVPDWMRNQYLSDLSANIGSNVGSGIGADYVSRGLLQQGQDYQNYYRDLGLSLAGRQPLAQPMAPQTTSYLSQFGPTAPMGFMAQNYGTFSQASRPEVGFSPNSTGQILGGLFQGAGSAIGGYLGGI